jgi:hypothetical protein
MKLTKKAGATSEIWQIFIQDTSKFDGSGLTGLTNASGSLTAYYHRDTDTTATVINLVSMTVGTFTSSGFAAVDGTNLPGVYQFCPPNAALASGAKSCVFMLKGATNMAPVVIEVQLMAVDPDSATAFMTGVNSVAPPTNWNLHAIDSNGRVDVIKLAGTSQTARDIGASVLVGDKTGFSLSADGIQAIWNALTSALSTASSIGKLLVDNLNATITSRMATFTLPTNFSSLSIDSSGRTDLGKWIGTAPNALQSGRVDSYLGAVAAGVIAAASFASGALDAVWTTTSRTLSTGAIVAGTFAANALDAVWSTAARVLTAGTNIVLAKGVGLTGLNDLSAAQVNAEADTALADVGLTGTVTGRIDAAVSSRLAAGSYTAPDNTSITAIKAKTDTLPSDPADASDIAAATNLIATGVAAVKAKTDNLPAAPAATGDIPSALTIATAVRTELATELARIDVALSTLSTYDGADPAGVVTLLDRLSDARATLLDNLANLDAAISAITLSSAERTAIADAYLDRVDGIETGLTPRQADRLIVSAVLAKASGMDANAPVFRDFNDSKDRVSALCDEAGNRLEITYDPS